MNLLSICSENSHERAPLDSVSSLEELIIQWVCDENQKSEASDLLDILLACILLGENSQKTGQALIHQKEELEAKNYFKQGLKPFLKMKSQILQQKENQQEAEECQCQIIQNGLGQEFIPIGNFQVFYMGLSNQAQRNIVENQAAAFKINPQYQEALYKKGTSIKQQRNFDEALKCYDEALKCYDKAIEINPYHQESLYGKGMSLYNLKKYDEALKCFDDAIKIKPYHYETLYGKGMSLSDLERCDEVIKCYDDALKINPQNLEALCGKGNILLYLEGYDEALKCFDDAIRIDPQNLEALCGKGNNLLYLKRYDEALKCFDDAIKIHPQHTIMALYGKGNTLHQMQRNDEALKFLDDAITIKPHYLQACANKGNSLRNLRMSIEKMKHQEASESLESQILDNINQKVQPGNPINCSETFVYKPPDKITIANKEYKVLNHIIIPQGAVLFCQTITSQFNKIVAIKESELMHEIEHTFVRYMFVSEFQNVAKVSQIYSKNKKQYYIMESSDITLQQQILESPKEILNGARLIIKQIISGITELHNCGWIHMQIEAQNIIIQRKHDNQNNFQDIYKISIWQSFKDVWDAQSKGQSYYIEPEYIAICKKHKNILKNYKIDLWAFGLLALKLYTGFDFQVQDKNSLSTREFQEINSYLLVNQFKFEPDVYQMLLELFDENSKKTAADIAQLFEKYHQEDVNQTQ